MGEFSADAQPKQQEVCRLSGQITSTEKRKAKVNKACLNDNLIRTYH